jgi:histidinol phosphatase-like enzyme
MVGVARPTICVDFDGTIVRWGDLMADPPTFESGAVDAISALAAWGYRIVILTSRLSGEWLRAARLKRADQMAYVHDALIDAGVPFDLITCEKVPALYYIDDRAIQYSGNWHKIATAIWGVAAP